MEFLNSRPYYNALNKEITPEQKTSTLHKVLLSYRSATLCWTDDQHDIFTIVCNALCSINVYSGQWVDCSPYLFYLKWYAGIFRYIKYSNIINIL